MTKDITIIVAIARDNAIGYKNRLLCHLTEDLKHFKQTTMGQCLVMGRLTFQSIGRPLPGRTTIVLTRSESITPQDGLLVARSLDEAIALCPEERHLFIAGGGNIYQQAMPLATKLIITRIDKAFTADAFFPAIDPALWRAEQITDWHTSENGIPYRFEEYQRLK